MSTTSRGQKKHLRCARDEAEAASEKLRVSEERFRLTIDEAPIGMALVALDGRFVRVNHALCEIVGYSPAELTTLAFHDITHPDDLAADVALAGQLASGKIPRYQLEKRYLRKDGTTVDIMLNGSILRDKQGAPLYYIAQIEDISKKKRLEEERARTLTERETLLKEIHHRVKNNLQVLSSLFYLQRQRTAEEPLRTLLDESRNRIQTIALIHEKLYQSERLAWIDFGDYLKDLTCRLTRAIGAQSPQARISIQADNVFLDIERAIPSALIVNELVSNALKHAFPGGRSGEIRITVGLVAPDLLELVVSDTGIGFPADLDFKNTNSLGLKLVCSLTTQLRGVVKLSRDGGTRFEIRFSVPPGKLNV
ncbi:MAG TPA: hypothetical protein DCQ33_06740 [Nitrospira sp.]|nr:hypothetical protein [Nitrospira sp.]